MSKLIIIINTYELITYSFCFVFVVCWSWSAIVQLLLVLVAATMVEKSGREGGYDCRRGRRPVDPPLGATKMALRALTITVY